MSEENKIDKFGKFLVENLRDKGISHAEFLLNARWKAPALQNIQYELSHLSLSQKDAVKKAVISTIDSAIHDFLFALQEQAGFDKNIQIIIDDENIVELSDGVHGEAYSDDGWYAKYSNMKQ